MQYDIEGVLVSDTGPVLTAALSALRAGFNHAFPDRDHTTDGWIGDAAHQAEVSGHNPDDTVGVRAEYSDADTKPEVRAIDVDTDLRSPLYSMQDVIDRILVTPNDLMRLKYIIFNRTIWSKNNGWRPAEYTGIDPHTGHAHFSGDPLYDENDTAWSVEDMALTAGDAYTVWYTKNLPSGTPTMSPATALLSTQMVTAKVPSRLDDLESKLDEVLSLLGQLVQPASVDPSALAKAVVDEESRRLAQ